MGSRCTNFRLVKKIQLESWLFWTPSIEIEEWFGKGKNGNYPPTLSWTHYLPIQQPISITSLGPHITKHRILWRKKKVVIFNFLSNGSLIVLDIWVHPEIRWTNFFSHTYIVGPFQVFFSLLVIGSFQVNNLHIWVDWPNMPGLGFFLVTFVLENYSKCGNVWYGSKYSITLRPALVIKVC